MPTESILTFGQRLSFPDCHISIVMPSDRRLRIKRKKTGLERLEFTDAVSHRAGTLYLSCGVLISSAIIDLTLHTCPVVF